MRKTLLILFVLLLTISTNATIFVFDKTPVPTVTASPYTAGCIYINGTDTVINSTTNSVTDVFVPISSSVLNLTTGQELSLSSKETDANIAAGKKALVFKGALKAIVLDGTKRKLKISGLTVGENILFSIGSKGSAAHTFTLTGATADANNAVLAAKDVDYVFTIWKYTATATEAIFYVETGGCIINSVKTGTDATITGVSDILTDKGVSFNGQEILNEKSLSLEVYNVLGKLVAKSTSSIDTDSFQKGIYIVRSNDSKGILKFIK